MRFFPGFSSYYSLHICIYSWYLNTFCVFEPLSPKVLVKCLDLHSGGFGFPPKEKGVFPDGQQVCTCSLAIDTNMFTNKRGLVLSLRWDLLSAAVSFPF